VTGDGGNEGNHITWEAVRPVFDTLLREPLTPTSMDGWLTRWSAAQKPLLERRVVLLRACAGDLTDAAAEAAYAAFAAGTFAPLEDANAALRAKALALDGWDPAPAHREFLRQWRARAALDHPANGPVAAAIAAATRDYGRTVAAMRVELDGHAPDADELRRLASGPDRATRERAWRASREPWARARGDLDILGLDLLARRRELARLAGMADYRAHAWAGLARLDYTPDDVLRFHDAVAEAFVPLAARRYETRRRELGVPTLRPWDLEAEAGATTPLVPFSDLAAFAGAMAGVFARTDPEVGALYARMRGDFLDLGARPGKRGGGQVMVFPESRLPFVLVSAGGSDIGIDLLLHEMGHAFHYALVMTPGFLVWQWEFPDEFTEFAAIAMTHFARPQLARARGGFYDEAEMARARRWYLDELVVFGLPALSLADRFEHWLYAEAPPDVGPRDLDAKWAELSARYTPWADWSGLEDARDAGWQRDEFLFIYPFYNLTYELGHIAALAVARRAQHDAAGAWRAYRAALALGNSRPLPALFAAAGAHLPLDPAAVRDAARFLAEELALTE